MIVYVKDHAIKIDAEDFFFFNSFKWFIVDKKGYFYLYRNSTGLKKTLYFAREIMKATQNMIVDHIDGDPLNNQKDNLRLVDKRKNAQNMKAHKDSTSEFKGVCWDKVRNKWRATIKVDGKQVHLGRFDTERKAAETYNMFAVIFFEEFARLNKFSGVS